MKISNKRGYLILILKGICMGSADIIPGVSGGTMAFILGIYEDLVKAIRSFDSNFIRLLRSFRIKDALIYVSMDLLLSVGVGISIAIISFSRAISFLLNRYPFVVWSFFFGLIVASSYSITKRVRPSTLSTTLALLAGSGIGYVLVGMVPISTPNSLYFIFLCGALSICAMILPGISGAFILVILGKYHFMLEAINHGKIVIISVFLGGALFGIILFSRVLNFLLTRYRKHTIYILSGLMLGSLRKIWPWKMVSWDGTLILSIGIMLMGISTVLTMDYLLKKG